MYTDEITARFVVSLLKEHGIKKIVASPGNTNYGVVGSAQRDPFFEVYSAPDERSAAYLACGLAELCGEQVVISCTGATASRNYLPGLTEAYYRKLPIIAVTSFNGSQNVGQLLAQNIDRSVIQRDVALYSVDLPIIKDDADKAYCNRVINEALLETRRQGGGPVHINLSCDYSHGAFEASSLEKQRVIHRFTSEDELPSMEGFNKIIVFIGAHRPFDKTTEEAIEAFSRSRNAVILADHTANYHGTRRIKTCLAAENTSKWASDFKELSPDLIIDMGEVSGDYVTSGFLKRTGAPVWRVSPDGTIRDRFGGLRNVFEMTERRFFTHYTRDEDASDTLFSAWQKKEDWMQSLVPELPFTNRWIARQAVEYLPGGSVLHLAILNSLRSWNYVNVDDSVDCFCNTGGFGIDGCLSTAIGASLADPDRLNLEVTGDLAFFYDMNALGNRHLGSNMRILLVNNGLGVEFRMPYSPASVLGKEVDDYIAASGHYRNHFSSAYGSDSPAKAWSESLGLTYLRAETKEEFLNAIPQLLRESDTPILLECFVNPDDEESAAAILAELDASSAERGRAVEIVKNLLPTGIKKTIKKVLS